MKTREERNAEEAARQRRVNEIQMEISNRIQDLKMICPYCFRDNGQSTNYTDDQDKFLVTCFHCDKKFYSEISIVTNYITTKDPKNAND